MQKFLRIAILLLVLALMAAVVYSQARLYRHVHAANISERQPSASSQLIAAMAARPPASEAPAAPAAAPAQLGSEASPVVVKLADIPASPEDIAEREKDREIQRGIEHYTERLAATSLANNYLLIFQSVIYFLTLLLLYLLLESVKKFADAASRSADAAKKSAEAAEAALKKHEKSGARKFPPRFYRKR